MERRGLTVREIARLTGCSPSMVRATLRGAGEGSLATTDRIARLLGCDAVLLIAGVGPDGGRDE